MLCFGSVISLEEEYQSNLLTSGVSLEIRCVVIFDAFAQNICVSLREQMADRVM